MKHMRYFHISKPISEMSDDMLSIRNCRTIPENMILCNIMYFYKFC